MGLVGFVRLPRFTIIDSVGWHKCWPFYFELFKTTTVCWFNKDLMRVGAIGGRYGWNVY